MSNFRLKNRGGGKAEAWLEDFDGRPEILDWQVTCYAKLMLMPDGECLIDTIDTPTRYSRQGYATELVKNLQKQFKSVAPIGITPSGKPFWDKLGMTDALGDER
jgi:hypothetical protein